MFNTSLPAIVVPARTILALAALLLGSISWSHASIVDNWLVSFHNCPGAYRTDALHRDSDGTLWVGCGTAAEGYGLFYSEDGGGSWAAAPVTPASKLAKFRVSSIVRGSNGQLRIAGFNAETKEMVLSLNTTSKPFAVTPFLVSVAQVGRQFHVGTYVELADGRGIAESLNGHDLLYREPDTATSSASTWVVLPALGFHTRHRARFSISRRALADSGLWVAVLTKRRSSSCRRRPPRRHPTNSPSAPGRGLLGKASSGEYPSTNTTASFAVSL